MKISARDIADGQRIAPGDIIDYLRITDWQKLGVYTAGGIDRSALWESPDQTVEVHVPLLSQANDYGVLLANVINQVARVEKRPAHQVMGDVRVTRADVLRVRRVGTSNDGPLPLVEGADLFAATASLVIAAASAAVEPRSAYVGRRHRKVQDFCRKVGFGQTEQGSYVVRVVIHHPPSFVSKQLSLLDVPPPERPFTREVTETLLSAVKGAQQAATRSMLDDDLSPFTEQVTNGVSADLCRALAGMASQEGHLDEIQLSIAWSRTWPRPHEDVHPVGFSPEQLGVFAEAARFLSEVEPREEFELIGYVTHLHREYGQKPGDITMLGSVDGRWRKVKVTLQDQDYNVAIQAHDREATVAVIGDLRKDGGQYRLERPHRLREVSELALDD